MYLQDSAVAPISEVAASDPGFFAGAFVVIFLLAVVFVIWKQKQRKDNPSGGVRGGSSTGSGRKPGDGPSPKT